ncbi:hypothetical protein L1987_10138 [Smallanthus sonchifolius]|uniref:Uncharacterized protein n=1 Tax=Smallanthus sonchifolius TaxID=185202 RepID=A0ACB9JR97_9ASTR|nr:hypothetical protein L1987_10138 [Smallanthus sonchifolius]
MQELLISTIGADFAVDARGVVDSPLTLQSVPKTMKLINQIRTGVAVRGLFDDEQSEILRSREQLEHPHQLLT